MNAVLVISNYAYGDESFDSDRGSWNVTRARQDCLEGKHSAFTFDIFETIVASSNVSVSKAKIADMMANPERLKRAPPLIFVEDGQSDDGRPMVWLIDGHHRVRALYGLGYTQCAAFVIEEKNAARYRLHFNGERTAPWMAWAG
jgi:hypothetical protein